MVNSYRSAEWRCFREEVLRLDEYRCRTCGRDRSDGVRLHVHHTRYLDGHKPWEYSYDMCETLCSGCHAAEHGLIFPKFGWEFIGYEDLGDLSGCCEICGNHIRHSFLVMHSIWGIREVGEHCCDNLTSTQVATGHLISLRSHIDKRKRFVSSTRWSQTSVGWHIYQKTIHIEVIRNGKGWCLRLQGIVGKKSFTSEVDAKAEAFDLVELDRFQRWYARQKKTRD